MTLDQLSRLLLNLQFLDVVRILAIIFTILYLVFAFVILRQVQLMTRTLPTPLSPLLVFISIVHIGVVLVVLVLLIGVL